MGRFNNLDDAIACRDEVRLRRAQLTPRKPQSDTRRVKKFGVRVRNDGMKTTYAVEVYHHGKHHYGGVFKTREGAQEKAQVLKSQLVSGSKAAAKPVYGKTHAIFGESLRDGRDQ